MVTTVNVLDGQLKSRGINHEKRCFVYFEDQAPSIGAGWRVVDADIGYKWVHVKEPHAKRRSKIKRAVWDKITERRYEAKPHP
jgi:hypothetical protein